VGGFAKQFFINILINLNDIKKGIPEYADAIMSEMSKSKTKEQARAMLNMQLEHYLQGTFDKQDTVYLDQKLLRNHSKDIESARIELNNKILVTSNVIFWEAAFLIILSMVLFALSGFRKKPLTELQYIALLLLLMTLLIAGVTTPMIDMEAKISQMSFMLMGHPIHFENQVLYFQSKSILDMFWIMITHNDFQLKCVAVLLITFSIIIPVLKLASSLIYYFNYRHLNNNATVKFFVFKSGKWSMADVMVVAIFMAYIGFNGMISSQFGQLRSADQTIILVTTNGTSLQPGYFLFLTYTLLALFLSGFLTRKPVGTIE
jgi:hypothetical protein